MAELPGKPIDEDNEGGAAPAAATPPEAPLAAEPPAAPEAFDFEAELDRIRRNGYDEYNRRGIPRWK